MALNYKDILKKAEESQAEKIAAEKERARLEQEEKERKEREEREEADDGAGTGGSGGHQEQDP